MYKYFLGILFYFLLVLPIQGQERLERYTAFGVIPEKANDSLYAKLKLAKDINEKLHLFEAIAIQHLYIGNTDSIFYYGDLLKNEVLKNKTQLEKGDYFLSKSYSFLGKGSFQKGLFDEAIKYYIQGIDLSQKTDNTLMYYENCLGLGAVYLHQNNFEKASKYLDVCVNQNESIRIKILVYSYLGTYYFEQKDIYKSKENYNKVKQYLKEQESPKLNLNLKLYLGKIAAYEVDNETALNYFEDVKNKALTYGFYDIHIESVLEIGKIYYQEKQYDIAEMILSMAYTNSIQWNRLELQKQVISSLIKLNVTKEDYKDAYNLMSQYIGVSNEITKKQNKKVVRDLEFKYETLEKEKEILTLKEAQLLKGNEIQRQKTIKNAFLIGFLIVLVPIIGLLYVYYQKLQTQSKLNATQEEVNQQQIASLLKEQELKLMKASIRGQDEERRRISRELHDSIGGNLAAIKLQLANLDERFSIKSNVLKELDATYNQVRDISHDLVREKFNKNVFTSIIEEYIGALNNASNQNIEFIPYPKDKVNAIADDLQVEIFKIIQELLTNALKHAKADNIDIHLNLYENELQLLFEDNGVGFDIDTSQEGIGFKNIRMRIEVLKAQMNIDSALNRGTAITIEIPVV